MALPTIFRNLFMSKAKTTEEIAELSIKLIVAAGNNNVNEIKRLQKYGANIDHKADITLGSGVLKFDQNGITQPESKTNALIVALHNGAFDAALYLAQEGSDGTHEREEDFSGFKNNKQKALDFILKDHVPEQAENTPKSINSFLKDSFDEKASKQRQTNYQTDLYTPEQRIQIFDALVANSNNPLDLVSEQTLRNALMWARSEMIPKLKEIGVEIEDRHFVDAANPIHRNHKAMQIMEAVLPYIDNVNVTDGTQNAGHKTASSLGLNAFKWLESKGLSKSAIAKLNIPTYASIIAGGSNTGDKTEEERIKFAQYLIDSKYDIHHERKSYGTTENPTDKAFNEGNVDIGLLYLGAGAKIKPEYLAQAITARHFNKVTTEELVELVDKFDKSNILNLETALYAYSEIIETISMNTKNIPLLLPVANALTQKGFKLDTNEFLGDNQNSAQLLLNEMNNSSQNTLLEQEENANHHQL